MKHIIRTMALASLLMVLGLNVYAQRYENGLVDKTIAVVGGEMISLNTLEQEVQMAKAQRNSISDKNMRCELLESILTAKLFLMQAKVDSLKVNNDMVEGELSQRIDRLLTTFGGDEAVEQYFGKPLYKLRAEWRRQFQDQSLTQQEQQKIAGSVPDMTPFDVKEYMDTVSKADIPMIPIKYQLSQICLYPDRDAAALEVKEKLLGLRERIIKGEKFSTLARIYSEDTGSAARGGELGMASKSIFWPVFSDAAMSLRPGTISQIVETPDGFHIIEVIEKKGDMFNARHILLKPKYTRIDRDKAFTTLDSLRTQLMNGAVSFEYAARFYSEDPKTKTNGGQMADPQTGSSYFEIDQLKPADYQAIKDLSEGQISQPIESSDNEGRDGNLMYKIIKVDKIIPAHPANYETDFNRLSALVKNQKQMKAIDSFIDGKIKTTHIVIDPLFKDCEFDRAGWKEKIRK